MAGTFDSYSSVQFPNVKPELLYFASHFLHLWFVCPVNSSIP